MPNDSCVRRFRRVPLGHAVAWLAILLLTLMSAAASAQQVDWMRRFGPAGYYDEALAVATDATGVYVTGRTMAPLPGTTGTLLDGFVRKYGFDGTTLWHRQFNINEQDVPRAIAVDSLGVYVAGWTQGEIHGAFVSRLTLTGDVVWTHVFDSQKLGGAWAVAAHETGIYVGGEIAAGAVLGKLDFDGREQWISAPFGERSGARFVEVTVDGTGIYGVGIIGAADVRRFDFDGREIGRFGDGTRQGTSVAVDGSGVYVAGYRFSGFSDYRLWKFDLSGEQSWSRVLEIPPGKLALDAGGLYVLLPNDYSAQPQVAKYTLSGHFVWQGALAQYLGGYGLALQDGALYVAGAAFGDSESGTNSFVARFSPTLPPQLRSLGRIDGSPAIATLVHDNSVPSVVARVRNANTGATISRVTFPAQIHPHELAFLPDRNNNGAPELVLFGINEVNGNIVAQVRDARSGALLNSVFFDKRYTTRGFAVVRGGGGGGQPALGVLGVSSNDLTRRVQLKDARTGTSIRAIEFDQAYVGEPLADLAVLPDINGNGSPELAMFAMAHPASGSRVMIKDAVSAAWISDIFYPSDYCVRDFAVTPDLDDDGTVELAALIEGCWPGADRVYVDVRDPSTGEQSALVGYGKLARPVALMPLPDFDRNGAPQLGVMALNVSADKDVLSVKDSATRAWTHNVTFLHEGYRHRDVVRLPDMNGNGHPEVAQLQERRSDGTLRVMIKDAATGAHLRVLR